MTQVKAEIKTPDGRHFGITSVNSETSGTMGTKFDPKTGRSFEWSHIGEKIFTKWK